MNRISILFTLADPVVRITNLFKTMTIRKIIGEHGPLSEICNGGSCPAAILTDGGDAYVQGFELEVSERGALSAPAGESFVRIPLPVLKKIAAQVIDA